MALVNYLQEAIHCDASLMRVDTCGTEQGNQNQTFEPPSDVKTWTWKRQEPVKGGSCSQNFYVISMARSSKSFSPPLVS